VGDQRTIFGLGNLTALDRTVQILPVPLAGLTPVRRRSSRLTRAWRRRRSIVLGGLGIVAILAGVLLWMSPRSFSVEMTSGKVVVDSLVLTPRAGPFTNGVRVFTGPATLAVSPSKSGTTYGGAVMTWGGVSTTGRCILHANTVPVFETCRFTNPSGALTSTDTFDPVARTWHRRYADGVDVSVTVPPASALIPVPFPLGH
jgi:hypothetical protein